MNSLNPTLFLLTIMLCAISCRLVRSFQVKFGSKRIVKTVDVYSRSFASFPFFSTLSTEEASTSTPATTPSSTPSSTSTPATTPATTATTPSSSSTPASMKMINLLTIEKPELEEIVKSMGYPKYRADQIWKWVRVQGVTDIDEMTNLPKDLRNDLSRFSHDGALTLDTEIVSKDGTRKRAYRLHDGQLIESVLMPYEDGRYTACISSQAGCAMGCVFCATGQGGFARQLTSDEIFEQVSRFASELAKENARLSNIVFMGMGEPLANYRNVLSAVNRITQDLGIGARKITISTVGIVPIIRKLTNDHNMPQIRLAVSLHNADDAERTALLPANGRYGGLDELMLALKDYVDTTSRRITLEWALIEGQNDTPDVARKLGRLVRRFGIRRDMIHVNVIPLNPTGGYGGSPSARTRVNAFTKTVQDEFGITCTPRVRRGIDIDAGCGQLKTKIEKKEKQQQLQASGSPTPQFMDFLESSNGSASANANAVTAGMGVYEQEEEEEEEMDNNIHMNSEYKTTTEIETITTTTTTTIAPEESIQANALMTSEFEVLGDAVDFDGDDFEDTVFTTDHELAEVDRLISLVQQQQQQQKPTTATTPVPQENNHMNMNMNDNMNDVTEYEKAIKGPTTTITDEGAVQEAKRRRKKLLKNLKAIHKLREMELKFGKELNEEQRAKIEREKEWKLELESLEHNLR